MDKSSSQQYNERGDAKHYDDGRINIIFMIENIWGTQGAMTFCEINAFKYRMRAGKKDGQPIEQELLKAKWYEKAAAYYFNKIEMGIDISGLDADEKYKLPF